MSYSSIASVLGMMVIMEGLQILLQSTQLLWMEQKVINTVRAVYAKQCVNRCVDHNMGASMSANKSGKFKPLKPLDSVMLKFP